MIIGIDASRANLQHKSGTEWYSFYLIKNLALLDSTDKYWLYLNRQPSPELAAAVKANPNFSFKVLNWPSHIFWTLGRLTLEMFWVRPDVLFIPAHALPLSGPFKTINTIHDLAFIRESNLYRSSKAKTSLTFSRPLINFLIRSLSFGRYSSGSVDYLYWSTAFALRHAKKIIAVSEFTRQEILKLYPGTKSDQIVAIHNGYDNERYKLSDAPEKHQEILSRYGLEAPYFLYVGRLEKKKNTPALVEAFAIFKENNPESKTKLVLIGDASFGYDEVKYAIEEFDLEDQVILPGWVQEEDLPYIFRSAQAFVFPSRHEGFGIPILQAFACGVPTAVSDIPVFHEVAGDAVIYFDQNDKRSIAAALTKISTDEALRRELRAKGLARVHEFSWRKCAAETLKLIESL